MQKRVVPLFLLGCLSGFAQDITIQNSSFEAATLPLFQFYGQFNNVIDHSVLNVTSGMLPAWQGFSTITNASAGALAPTEGGGNWTTTWFSGKNVGYLQIGSKGVVSMSQTLSAKLQNNTMYTLSVVVGHRLATPRFNYSIQLWVGSTLLASSRPLVLPSDSFGRDSVSYATGPTHPLAGQPIRVVLAAVGADGYLTEAFFDQISLTAKSVLAVNGVVSPAAFGGYPKVASGGFVEIYGSNLATSSREWSGSDFVDGTAPVSLEGTSVTIGGRQAFITYVSPSQVNALIPSDVPEGRQQVSVSNTAGSSAAFTTTISPVVPGLLASPDFVVKGTQYVVALNSDGTYALPAGTIPGLASHPAAPGDTLVFYGVGFGPVTPKISAGQLVKEGNSLATTFQMFIGGMPATAIYSGLAPNYTGLYQFNIVVPNVDDSDAAPVTFALGGTNGAQQLYIAVQK
jgi:uncharacterized protein (TIGR03437 family)